MIVPMLSQSARVRIDANTIMVIDGNSLVAGVGASGATKYMSAQLQAMAPISNVVTITNKGVGGQTIDNMITAGFNIDALYVAGKKNILLAWEGTNQIISNNITGAAAGVKMGNYVAARLAANAGWKIVLIGTIPRQSVGAYTQNVGGVNGANAELIAYDNYLRDNWRAMGAKEFITLRNAGSIFVLPDYTSGSFENPPYINYEAAGESTAHIHLNDLGYNAVAQIVAAALRRLPSR